MKLYLFIFSITCFLTIVSSCSSENNQSSCYSIDGNSQILDVEGLRNIPKEFQFSPSNKIDSLEKMLAIVDQEALINNRHESVLCDTLKIKILYALSCQYHLNSNNLKAVEYANQMLNLSEDLNLLTWKADAYNQIGVLYDEKGNYSKALDAYLKAYAIRQQIGSPIKIAQLLNNIADNYRMSGDLYTAIEFQLNSLKTMEEAKNLDGIASGYNNLGLIYFQLGEFKRALEYENKCLYFRKEQNSKLKLAIAYNNLGRTLSSLAVVDYYNNDTLSFKSKLNNSFENYSNAKIIFEQIGYKKGIAQAITGLANIRYYQNDFLTSLKMHRTALMIRSDMGLKSDVAESYINIGAVYSNMKDSSITALSYQKMGLELAEEISDTNSILNAHSNISIIAADSIKDYELAYTHLKLFQNIIGFYRNEQTRTKILIDRAKIEYEYNKKLELEDQRKQEYLLFQKFYMICLFIVICAYIWSVIRINNSIKAKSRWRMYLYHSIIPIFISFLHTIVHLCFHGKTENKYILLYILILISGLLIDPLQKVLENLIKHRLIKE